MARRRFPPTNMDRNTRDWTRAVENFVHDQDARNEREDSSGLNAAKARSSAAKRQAATIRSLPFVSTGYDSQSGFGLVDGWNTVATVRVSHPEGWAIGSILAVGGAAALDDLSGGLTICEGRIVIGSQVSPTFAPAKDAGASKVNNILSPNFGISSFDATAASSTLCMLQLRPINPIAFPAKISNYSSLAVTATFINNVFPETL